MEPTIEPAKGKPSAPDASAGPKSFGVTLKSGDGKESIRITGIRRKDGKAETFATHFTGKTIKSKNKAGEEVERLKGDRGATRAHTSMEVAKIFVDELVSKLTKKGWGVQAKAGVGKKHVDAFDLDSLPSPKVPFKQK